MKAVLIGAVPQITVKSETNSGGTPLKTFARLRKSVVGKAYVQGPQKYHAKSLQVLREKYKAAAGEAGLNDILKSSDCLRYLA